MSFFSKKIFPVLLLLLPLLAFSKEPPPAPNPPQLVNDFSGILSSSQVAALERKLVAYDDSTSTQIAIVIENSIEGDDMFEYSFRLAEKWGIGRQGKNNGVLVYIAFKDRKLRIQTGYGAEGFLPDAMARRIIDQVIAPSFRKQDYYNGLNEATDIIMKLGSGEYQNDDVYRDDFPFEVLIFIIIFIIIVIIISKGGGGGYYGGGRYNSDRGGWIIIGPGGGGRGHWDGGGGFGGGGFGGFGGGGFGGGGAGGGW
ncbi:MAG: TPM domain-containing protein [Saprospiraceae bacterium]